MKKRSAFTLIEVMVAVAVLGLSAAGSLRLLTMSVRALEDVRYERHNLSLARTLWLAAVSDSLDERGREKEYSWETKRFTFERQEEVPEGFYCRQVDLVQGDPMSRPSGSNANAFIFYVPDMKEKKERTK